MTDILLTALSVLSTIIVALLGFGYKNIHEMITNISQDVNELKFDLSARMDRLDNELKRHDNVLMQHTHTLGRVEALINGKKI